MSDDTYALDVEFLDQHADVVELASPGGGRIAVTPDYQGRVMTSATGDGEGASLGWVNRPFIAAGAPDPHFNNYGGEDRFWLGPEAGRFALWFRDGEPFDLEHWKTPEAFGAGSFHVEDRDERSVAMTAKFDVTNYSGTTFRCAVERTVSALDRRRAAELLGASPPDELAMVGFESANTLTNAGEVDWTRAGGLLSIWTLGQFDARAGCWAIIPFRAGDDAPLGPKATTDYFGELPPERFRLGDDRLLFCCDGQWRSKVGIAAPRARSICGSYDPGLPLLTVVQFDLPSSAADLPYVNSRWELLDSPAENFAGDAINAYSDGPESGHDTKSTPFYEIETSSPAAELKPAQSLTHRHRTFHFTGELNALDELGRAVLGVSLGEIG